MSAGFFMIGAGAASNLSSFFREVGFQAGRAGLFGGGGFAGEELGEVFLGSEFAFPFLTFATFRGTIGLDEVGVLVVAESDFQNVDEEILGAGVVDGGHEFDPLFQVASHPVGR